MSVVVINAGVWERDTSGNRTTKHDKTLYGETGTVRVVVEGIEHVFAPGQSKAFADDGLGTKVAAASSQLRAIDSREGTWKANASLSASNW